MPKSLNARVAVSDGFCSFVMFLASSPACTPDKLAAYAREEKDADAMPAERAVLIMLS